MRVILNTKKNYFADSNSIYFPIHFIILKRIFCSFVNQKFHITYHIGFWHHYWQNYYIFSFEKWINLFRLQKLSLLWLIIQSNFMRKDFCIYKSVYHNLFANLITLDAIRNVCSISMRIFEHLFSVNTLKENFICYILILQMKSFDSKWLLLI